MKTFNLYKVLRKAMKDNAVEGKVTTWWPLRPSAPGFSIHVDGTCVISANVFEDELVQSVVVNKKGVKEKLAGETVAKALAEALSGVVTLWPTEVTVLDSPKPFGKKPRE